MARLIKVLITILLSAAWCWPAPQTFQHDVLPLIEKRCVTCHGAGRTISGGLDLRTIEGVMGQAAEKGFSSQTDVCSIVSSVLGEMGPRTSCRHLLLK